MQPRSPTCKKKKRLLLHSSRSALWHEISSQGSFKTSCNSEGEEKQTDVKARRGKTTLECAPLKTSFAI